MGEGKIGACARFFAEHPGVRLVVHAGQPVDEHLNPVGPMYPPASGRRVAPAFGADPWLAAPGFATVFDASLLRLADWRGRPPSRDLDGHAMDFDEWVYFLAWGVGEVAFIGDCLVRYRQHGSNLVGAPAPGWRGRVRKVLHDDFATHAGRAGVALAYGEFLERLAGTPAGQAAETHARLEAGVRYWRGYEELSRRRDAFYAAQMLEEQLRRLGKLVVSRAYRSRETGGLGGLALVRDLREIVLRGREVDRAPV